MSIYLKIDGIDGEATHAGHAKWIDILSFQWGVGRAISTPVGSAAKREASEPSVSEITMTKHMDKSSVSLFQEACTGTGKTYKIDFVTTGDPGENYLTFELTNGMISGYSISSGGDRPLETISVNFTKVDMRYTSFDQDQKTATPVNASYDLASGKKA